MARMVALESGKGKMEIGKWKLGYGKVGNESVKLPRLRKSKPVPTKG
jgi:hypothetical protein